MADGVHIDFTELREFEADLGRVSGRALKEVDAILKRGAQNIKKDMAAAFEGSRHFKAIAPSVSYDSDYRPGQVVYEIGPDKDRGGNPGRAAALAHIAVYGGARGGGGTVDIDAVLDKEEPRLMKALDDFLGGVL